MIHACHNKQGRKITSQHRTFLPHVSTQAPMYQRIENKPKEPSLWFAAVVNIVCVGIDITPLQNDAPLAIGKRCRRPAVLIGNNSHTQTAHRPCAESGERTIGRHRIFSTRERTQALIHPRLHILPLGVSMPILTGSRQTHHAVGGKQSQHYILRACHQSMGSSISSKHYHLNLLFQLCYIFQLVP